MVTALLRAMAVFNKTRQMHRNAFGRRVQKIIGALQIKFSPAVVELNCA
jgi:hypothetical protein